MLKKLLKYDFYSVRRFGFPILVALLAAGVLGAGSIAGLIASIRSSNALTPLLSTCFSLLFSLVGLVISIGAAGIGVAILVDYYKTLVTDEAYLTFTLPVRASDILWSKLINALIWTAIATLLTALTGAMMLVAGLATGGVLTESIAGFFMGLKELFSLAYAPSITVLLVLLLLAITVNNVLLLFMSIFFGSVVAKKNKLLWVIGSVIVVDMIYSTVSSLVYTLCLIPLMAAHNPADLAVAVHVTLILYILALSGLSVLFFYLTKKMMETRLNLA